MSNDLRFKDLFIYIIKVLAVLVIRPFAYHFCRKSKRCVPIRGSTEHTLVLRREERYPVATGGFCERRVKDVISRGCARNPFICEGRTSLIILADMLKAVYSEEVCHPFMKGTHHKNISVIPITQTYFTMGATVGTFLSKQSTLFY